MADTTADILRKAKAHISDPKNWNKDGSHFKDGDKLCACVFGAISVVCDCYRDNPNGLITNVDFTTLLQAALPEGHLWVTVFNDHPDTTHSDLMAFMDRAIALAEAEASQ